MSDDTPCTRHAGLQLAKQPPVCAACVSELRRENVRLAVQLEHQGLAHRHEIAAVLKARIGFRDQFCELLGIPPGQQVEVAHEAALARVRELIAKADRADRLAARDDV